MIADGVGDVFFHVRAAGFLDLKVDRRIVAVGTRAAGEEYRAVTGNDPVLCAFAGNERDLVCDGKPVRAGGVALCERIFRR